MQGNCEEYSLQKNHQCKYWRKEKLLHIDCTNRNMSTIETFPVDTAFLNLGYNRIKQIDSGAFKHSHELVELDLSDNIITQCDRSSFDGLHKLRRLYLNSNHLNYSLLSIPEGIFKPLLSLTYLNIKDNLNDLKPNIEDIVMKDLRELESLEIDVRKTANETVFGNEYSQLRHLKQITFGICLLWALVSVAVAVSLVVLSGGLAYRYRWKIRYAYHITKKKYWRHLPSRQESHYEYNAFISFAEKDRDFILKECIPNLEAEENIKLCIHCRDFLPGEEITTNITNAIHQSGKTICLISKAFLESYYCNFEFNMARMESIHGRNGEQMLFLIFYEQVKPQELPLVMLELIDRKSYIEYPNDEQGNVVFWAKIKESLSIHHDHANCCILNGRNFVNNDYTCVSTKGCSVVDYCIVPYDNLNLFKDFCVIRANDLVTSAGFDVNGVDLKLIPDHSLIKWSIDLNAFMSNVQPKNENDKTFSTKFEKFDFNKIPANFMNTNNVYQNICSLIESLKTVEHQQNCVNGIYDDFCKTVESEMSDKIPSKTIFVGGKQSNKKYRNKKPWWNESLSKLWYEMCNAEKAWNKCKNMHQNQLKAIYVQKRKHFDSEVQKSKRKYWYDMQEQLLSESSKNQHMFWKKIGKIGIAESRKHVISMEVIDDDGIVSSELTDVLDKWKSEYSELLNQQNSSIRVSDSCTSLNEASTFNDFLLTEPISYQETVHVIEKTKRGKSAGIDNLPGEIW
ncbi:unnamed protein product [Mytilus edulis]|uniref:TIR domain-containing protein n=1 Tax=Mytilus edulis TaxID=6550 RepID=A0A8S3QLH8_MYTED|nr:unnamed protein product [Mytilus edulis]